MVTDSRPLVVVGGQIHPDGRALLEREVRVIVTEDSVWPRLGGR